MNIKLLSNMTNTSKETLRVYREKGLLRPYKNHDNQYYEYSLKELCTLLYVKKLRYFNLSLQSIQNLLCNQSSTKMIHEYDEQIIELEKEVETLKKKISHLKLARSHIQESQHKKAEVKEMIFDLPRYDFYGDDLIPYLKNSYIYINSLHIRKSDILDESKIELPIEIGLGVDVPSIQNYDITLPPNALCFEAGLYLSMCIDCDNLTSISKSQIQPLLDYAKTHHYRLISDVTSFLVYIDRSGEKSIFTYRIRVQVEKINK